MRAIIFGAEKYSVCPLCAQEVPTDVFEDEGYRKLCRREVRHVDKNPSTVIALRRSRLNNRRRTLAGLRSSNLLGCTCAGLWSRS